MYTLWKAGNNMIYIWSKNDAVSYMSAVLLREGLKNAGQEVAPISIEQYLGNIALPTKNISDATIYLVGYSYRQNQLNNVLNLAVIWITPYGSQNSLANETMVTNTEPEFKSTLDLVRLHLKRIFGLNFDLYITMKSNHKTYAVARLYDTLNQLSFSDSDQDTKLALAGLVTILDKGLAPDELVTLSSHTTSEQKPQGILVQTWKANPALLIDTSIGESLLVKDNWFTVVTSRDASYEKAKLYVKNNTLGLLYFDFKTTGSSVLKFMVKDKQQLPLAKFKEHLLHCGFDKVIGSDYEQDYNGYATLKLNLMDIIRQ